MYIWLWQSEEGWWNKIRPDMPLSSFTPQGLYCISKLQLQTFIFKKYDDFVKSWAFCINDLHEYNKEVCWDLTNDYGNKKEQLNALEEKVKCLSQQLLMMMVLLEMFLIILLMILLVMMMYVRRMILIMSSSCALLATNELVSPEFEKHTRGVGSQNIGGGLGKSRLGSAIPIESKMSLIWDPIPRWTSLYHCYAGRLFCESVHAVVLFIAGHSTELQGVQLEPTDDDDRWQLCLICKNSLPLRLSRNHILHLLFSRDSPLCHIDILIKETAGVQLRTKFQGMVAVMLIEIWKRLKR